ncbi:hypothetical protein DBV15_03173, partial [Temnothorax longispinosus]
REVSLVKFEFVRRSLAEKSKTIFRPPSSKFAFSLSRFFSLLLLLQAAVRNNLPSVEQSITLYNESLTQCQNADPLIFHVVSPGTRAVTAPPNPGRIYTADLIHVVDAGPASCLDVAIHYSPPTLIRATFRQRGTHLRGGAPEKERVSRICFTDCLVKCSPLYLLPYYSM